ncbi:MAG: hypothetical protein KGJ90_00470 [Patescibacteria group bacterium]|nr:hypothetical protein [Patescibacteria group bacterium]
MPEIVSTIVPTGGAISLQLTTVSGGSISLQRAVSGSSGLGPWTTLYSGAVLGPYGTSTPFFDIGDGLPGPLDPNTSYVYKLTDNAGSVQTPPLTPSAELNLLQEPITQIMIRLLQAGINSLAPPADIKLCQVLHDMPLAGIPTMPFVTVNLDLDQQAEIPIGQSVPNPDNSNLWTITGFSKRVYRISVLSTNSVERDFYRDAVKGIFLAILPSTLQEIGINVRHSYQITSGQVASEKLLQLPGFYFADIMLEMTGTYNIAVTSTLGIINTIEFTGYTSDGTDIVVQIPP